MAATFPHWLAGVAYVSANPETAGHADMAQDNRWKKDKIGEH